MKTLFAALASASILAAPLAASAQPGQFDHHGGWQGRGQAAGGQAQPAPAPQAQAPNPNQGRGGGWRGQGGASNGGGFNRGFNNGAQAQAPQRNFGGQQQRNYGQQQRNYAQRQQGFAGRDQGRDYGRDYGRGSVGDHRDYNGRGFENRGYANRSYNANRGYNAYRGNYRAYDPRYARDFRWGVGAYLPRSYWSAFIDPYAYGLDAAPWGYHWVIVDGEALLIQDATGAIVQAYLL